MAETPSGSIPPSAPPNALSEALTTSDTSNRNATLRIMPNENSALDQERLEPSLLRVGRHLPRPVQRGLQLAERPRRAEHQGDRC